MRQTPRLGVAGDLASFEDPRVRIGVGTSTDAQVAAVDVEGRGASCVRVVQAFGHVESDPLVEQIVQRLRYVFSQLSFLKMSSMAASIGAKSSSAHCSLSKKPVLPERTASSSAFMTLSPDLLAMNWA